MEDELLEEELVEEFDELLELEPEREELLDEEFEQPAVQTGSVCVQNGPDKHVFDPAKSTQQYSAEDELLELLEPLLEDEEEEELVHLVVQTGNVSVQEVPVKQVLKPPTSTQQKPVEEELLEELELEDPDLEELDELELDEELELQLEDELLNELQ